MTKITLETGEVALTSDHLLLCRRPGHEWHTAEARDVGVGFELSGRAGPLPVLAAQTSTVPCAASYVELEDPDQCLVHATGALVFGGRPDPPQKGDRVYLLRFSRHPQQFCEALAMHAGLRAARDRLRSAFPDEPHELHGKDQKVFLPPKLFRPAYDALRRSGKTLEPFHVLCSASLFPLVMQAVKQLPSRSQVRLKAFEDLTPGTLGLQERRTFLELRPHPPKLNAPAPWLAPPPSVASTTDAKRGRAGPNPRRPAW